MLKSKVTLVLEIIGRGQSLFFKREGCMTDRFLTFNSYGNIVCDPFLDEFMVDYVEPMSYYGYSFLESSLLQLCKTLVAENPDKTAEKIGAEALKYILYEYKLNKETLIA